MQRREFLKQSGVAGAGVVATALGGPFVHASDKAGTKNPVVGQGDHRYECVHGWGELPAHLNWQTTHGVCVDEAGLIYIKHQGTGKIPMDTIVVFDGDGKFVRSFGK